MKQKNDEWRAKVCAPQAFLEQIDSFVASLCEVERENLIGVYLHGSLAMGCFHPGQSDLDLLVLIQQPPTPERIHAWAHQILQSSCAPAPVELSVLVRAQYTPWQHPTPYTFHFSESWRSALFAALNEGTWHDWEQEHSLDPDLAAHFTITRRRGVRLAGTPIADAVPVVPWPDYLDSIRRDFDWASERAQDNPVYLVLNACRIWAAVSDKMVLSKAEGAVWAMPHLPRKIKPIVATAAAQYRGGHTAPVAISGAQALTVAQWVASHLV